MRCFQAMGCTKPTREVARTNHRARSLSFSSTLIPQPSNRFSIRIAILRLRRHICRSCRTRPLNRILLVAVINFRALHFPTEKKTTCNFIHLQPFALIMTPFFVYSFKLNFCSEIPTAQLNISLQALNIVFQHS